MFVISTLVARVVYHHIHFQVQIQIHAHLFSHQLQEEFVFMFDEHCSCSSSSLSSLRQTLCFQYSPHVRLPEASRSCDKSDFSLCYFHSSSKKSLCCTCPCSLSFPHQLENLNMLKFMFIFTQANLFFSMQSLA